MSTKALEIKKKAGSQRYLEDAVVLEGRNRGGSPKLERQLFRLRGTSGRQPTALMRHWAHRRETVEALH